VTDASGKLKPTDQKLLVHNSAKVTHNTKITGAPPNSEQNVTLPSGGKPKEFNLYPSNEPVTVACSIHPWMKGYIRIFNHPYAAVSVVGKEDKDEAYGTYEIKGVPAGATVRIFAWHEKAGMLGEPKGQSVKLEKESKVDFSMKAPAK